MFTGSCLCGGLKYEIHGELEPVQVCHCQQCRKAQGAPFATNIPVSTDNFSVVEGEEILREYESSPGKFRVFCSVCGSPIISKLSSSPESVRVRAGTIDQDLPVTAKFHAFVAHKANWWEVNDGLPQFSDFAS